MTETEISELRQAVLKLWEGSEYLILRDGLQEKILTLKRELAENSFSSLGEYHHLKQSDKMLGLLSLKAMPKMAFGATKIHVTPWTNRKKRRL